MTLTIELPSELEQALRSQAAHTGQDLSELVVEAVRDQVARSRTFREVCAPFARAVEASGMDDEEFDRFFNQARQERWREKHQ
jgi:predicted transcriptional regulator